MKEILLQLANELEDLRAKLVVIGQLAVNQPTSYAQMQDAVSLAKQDTRKHFDELRSKIEKLAL